MLRVRPLLDQYKCSEAADANLTSFFGGSGKYNVPADVYDEFLQAYLYDLQNGAVLGIIERRSTPLFPMIFDLDFTLPDEPARLKALRLVMDTFRDYIVQNHLIITGVKDSWDVAAKLVYQDGQLSHRNREKFHVVFPTILVDTRTGKGFVDFLHKELRDPQWKQWLDVKVVTDNGLRMLGSFKKESMEGGCYVPCHLDENGDIVDDHMTIEVLRRHSVRNASAEGAVSFVDIDLGLDTDAPEESCNGSSNSNSNSSTGAGKEAFAHRVTVPMRVLRSAVMALPASFYSSGTYQDWARVVWVIHNLAGHGDYKEDGLQLAHEFSKQAADAYDSRRVDKMYHAADARPRDRPRLGWRWLFQQLSQHQPELAAQLAAQVETIKASHVPEEWDATVLREALADMLGVYHEAVDELRFTQDAIAFRVRETAGAGPAEDGTEVVVEGSVRRQDGAVYLGGEYKGHACQNVRIEDSLALLHSSIPESARWVVKFVDHDIAELRNNAGELQALVTVHKHLEKDKTYLTMSVGGMRRGVSIRNRHAVGLVHDRVIDSVKDYMFKTFGVSQNYFDRCVFNITLPEGETRRSEGVLVNTLLQSRPALRDTWAFDEDAKSACRNGLFQCQPDTRVWTRVHNAIVESRLRIEFVDVRDVVPAERSWMFTRRGIIALREEFAGQIIRPGFEATLDTNLDVFPLAGGMCFDTRTMQMRRLVPEDRVQKTAGWEYDPALAAAHRGDVERFFEQLFPVPEERDVVLRVLAGILSGRRYLKKVLCLTDRRAGCNGKSTLVKLLNTFVGDLGTSDNKLLIKGGTDRGRDQHDAGLEPYKGYRLAVLEELKKSQKLDEGLLKNLSGGVDVAVQGRRIGVGDRFKYTWGALVVMVFNEGDIPQFDLTDQAMIDRLLFAPMRSRFEPGFEASDDDEPYTYAADASIPLKMPLWRSAFLDLLKENYVPEDIRGADIPEGMREWRRDVVNDRNDIAEWLEKHVEKLDERSTERFAVSELQAYAGQMGVETNGFETSAVAWLRANNFHYRDMGRIRLGTGWKTVRKIVVHARIVYQQAFV